MTLRNDRGFTLVELIVSMAVFIFVIMITTDAFNLILLQTSKLMQSEESNIEGIVGLEQFRHDLQQSGFGLPYAFVNSDGTASANDPQYEEAKDSPASDYNDAPSGIPRAIMSGNDLTGVGNIVTGSDYLVLRGTSLAKSAASQKWTYVSYSSTSPKPHAWQSSGENFVKNDWVIALRRAFTNGKYVNQLVLDPDILPSVTSNLYYSFTYDPTGFLTPVAFNPSTKNDIFFIYGIAAKDLDDISMPFNRTDYFVLRPAEAKSMPASCAPNTGILYKGNINQEDGKTNYSLPLMDCIADMQVIYGWDLKSGGASGTDGLIDTYSRADGGAVSGEASIAEVKGCLGTDAQQPGYPAAPECIRTSLKLVKVFILAQNGKKDPNYTSPASYQLFDTGESTLGRTYALGNSMRNYRWKVYKLVVRPKNLTSNN
ncbi:type II secretion system GspH family protein [Geobacter pelophilus]|uniref:Type II secretion system GspH family protein n=1 Tax=Geoanaerobacter pelophilus TaxID=60036 RepID=A0AAW4L3A4_9BACT|nr:PilW family protein [Geoanaerobacter pelophilus]MBT0665629.1 type II secretion system GspH family protein [Geoanaerobacter pelophilus]